MKKIEIEVSEELYCTISAIADGHGYPGVELVERQNGLWVVRGGAGIEAEKGKRLSISELAEFCIRDYINNVETFFCEGEEE